MVPKWDQKQLALVLHLINHTLPGDQSEKNWREAF